ncbi:MAG: amidohydrolase family protein [Proteobacteria bacterium]|nr:amidohydrolase family protein [Pseudomonadota bacterium]
MTEPGSEAWLALVQEDIIEPDLPIVDPHHHLWRHPGLSPYLLENLWADTSSGHNVVKTVFVECHAEYRKDGPDHERPLGETEFVCQQADASDKDPTQATIAGIVGHVDLSLDNTLLRDLLAQHATLAGGRFRGIRDAGARADHPEVMRIAGRAAPDHYQRESFREGVRLLGKLGLTYDTWHYHYQNRDYLELAQACPDTTMILDHFGTPLGVGPYASQKAEIFEQWKVDIAEIAKCPNVVAKIGGMAMPDNGFGWHDRDTPPTSDEFAEAQRPYYLHTIECFGPERCLMESNFPVDRWSISYHVLYNGLKKIVKDFTPAEKLAMFHDTAARVYNL